MARRDDTVTIDLTNYRDRMGGRVPEGRYLVRVDAAEKDRSSKGNAMINLWLVVAEGEYEGITIIDRLVDTEKSQFRIVNFMQAIGSKTPRAVLNFRLRTWVGRFLTVDVEDDEAYKGRIKSVVRGYMRAENMASTATAERDVEDWPMQSDDDEDDPLDEFGPTITDDSVEDVEEEEEYDEEEDDELAGDDGGDLPLHDDAASSDGFAETEAAARKRMRPDPVPTTLGYSASASGTTSAKRDDGDIDLEDLEL